MHVHILGICGTFMSGIAVLAHQRGHVVTGSDRNFYPPMSTQLQNYGISCQDYLKKSQFHHDIERIIVGNSCKRGDPLIEHMLRQRRPYISGPQWLAENVLTHKIVIAVAGTHGKTTTSSLLAWILEVAGLQPGFLIGGIPENFGVSARLGEGFYFVVEADEYDSAFFDKRSKFIHYRPHTAILNNLEFDHADIFPDLSAITQQFHYLLRTIPDNGSVIWHADDKIIQQVLAKGCWTPTVTFGCSPHAVWRAELREVDGSAFSLYCADSYLGKVEWSLLGRHNVENALAAVAAAYQFGVAVPHLLTALSTFKNVKRRLERKTTVRGITVYDDFAHHPTAIATTLAGLRAHIACGRIIAVLEFGSYTMRAGYHQTRLPEACGSADMVVLQKPKTAEWDIQALLAQWMQPVLLYDHVDALVHGLVPQLREGDHVVVMSNTHFDDIHNKLFAALSTSVETL